MRTTIMLLLICASLANAADYWPMELGKTFVYGNGSEVRTVNLQLDHDGESVVRWTDYEGPDGIFTTESYGIDGSGNVVVIRGGGGSAWEASGAHEYQPPYVLLDYPLYAGKIWATSTYRQHLIGIGPSYYDSFFVSVQGPVTVTVPAGTFDVMVVEVTPSVTTPAITYWLDLELGPVKYDDGEVWELVSWSGEVSNDDMTWSDVKTLYR